MKNQKGFMSIFVLFAMLLLLIFVLCVYLGIRNNLQLQEYKNLEIKEIYSKNIDVVGTTEFAPNNELIPIYNIEQFDKIGTGSYLKINNKIYQCGIGMSYLLKNNIIVDIDEDLKYKKVGFNDYKLYLSTYYIDKLGYNIYYYKNGSYWKCIAYQKFNEENTTLIKNKTYSQEQFSMIGSEDYSGAKQFMIVWNDEDGLLTNVKIEEQNLKNNVLNINEINVFSKNYQYINKQNGEFYIFVNIGNSI